MSSGRKEDTQYKHIKISDDEKKSVCTMSKKEKSLLEKIKLMIGEQMDSLNNDLINQNLEGLTRRVEQRQCKKTHEEIAKSFLNKVSKLERHINDVIAFQDKVFSEKTVHQAEQ